MGWESNKLAVILINYIFVVHVNDKNTEVEEQLSGVDKGYKWQFINHLWRQTMQQKQLLH